MDGRQGSEEKPGRGLRLGTRVSVWYLTTGAALAVTRVALFLWVAHRFASETETKFDYSVLWLYPEGGVVASVWHSLSGFDGAEYYVAWCSLITIGSFVMATPILLVGLLRQRRR
jgi:hypothetical protein